MPDPSKNLNEPLNTAKQVQHETQQGQAEARGHVVSTTIRPSA